MIQITCTVSDAAGTAKLKLCLLNSEVFEQAYSALSQNTMTTTYFREGGKMEGTINANRDGLFYTSIPYEKGWKAYVDGEEVEITPVGGSLLAFPLEKGEHTIVMKYLPNGFVPGLLVSIFFALMFAAICVYVYVLKRKLIPDFAMDIPESDVQEN